MSKALLVAARSAEFKPLGVIVSGDPFGVLPNVTSPIGAWSSRWAESTAARLAAAEVEKALFDAVRAWQEHPFEADEPYVRVARTTWLAYDYDIQFVAETTCTLDELFSAFVGEWVRF